MFTLSLATINSTFYIVNFFLYPKGLAIFLWLIEQHFPLQDMRDKHFILRYRVFVDQVSWVFIFFHSPSEQGLQLVVLTSRLTRKKACGIRVAKE